MKINQQLKKELEFDWSDKVSSLSALPEVQKLD